MTNPKPEPKPEPKKPELVEEEVKRGPGPNPPLRASLKK
jgi:hypothetical protein